MEEARGNEDWFRSCETIVKKRFLLEDYEAHVKLGVSGIQIKRVRKIKNYFLKSLFEKKLDILMENYNDPDKRKIEFMFYGVDPLFPGEIT